MTGKRSYYCIGCLQDKENRSENNGLETLFRFPNSPTRRKRWLANLGLNESDIKWRSKVCERHFSSKQFVGRTVLRKDAVPASIQMPKDKHETPSVAKSLFKQVNNRQLSFTQITQINAEQPCPPKRQFLDITCMQPTLLSLPPPSQFQTVGTTSVSIPVMLLPVVQLQSPVVQLQSPVVQLQSPVVQLQSPVVQLQSPVVQLQSPVVQLQSPVVQLQSPVVSVTPRSFSAVDPDFALNKSSDIELATIEKGSGELTKKVCQVAIPEKQQIPKTTRYYKQRISNLLGKIKRMKSSNENNLNLDKVFAANPGLSTVIKSQVSRYTNKISPYSQFEKALSLSLYYSCGRNGYRSLLSMGLKLPAISTLRSWMGNFQFEPGFNLQVLDCVNQVLSRLDNKDCVLMWDEMSIKEWMEYNKTEDKFEGIVDYGDEGRSLETADEVLVFMIHGIKTPWKFPIAFFFSKNATPSSVLEKLVRDCIKRLFQIGLNVRLCVCDMGFTNQGLYRSLNISEEKPFDFIEGKKVYFIHDAPHLIKLVRNNLNKHDFIITENYGSSGGVVKWRHIQSFYDKDRRTPSRMAPKLTSAHLYLKDMSKMRVKLAVQVLSFSVYAGIVAMCKAGILKDETLVTAFFIKMIDEIFDFMNTSRFSNDKFGRCASAFLKNLSKVEEYLRFLNCIEVVGLSRTPEFLFGLKITLKGIQMLSYDLQQEGDTKIYTRRLQQDNLEHFFGAVRMKGGYCKNPTAKQFRLNFRCLFFCHMMINPTNGNCESIKRNFYKSLQTVENILCTAKKTKNNSSALPHSNVIKSHTAAEFYDVKINRRLKLGETQEAIVAAYVGASSVKSIAESKNCINCKEMLEPKKTASIDTILTDAKQFNDFSSSLSYLTTTTYKFFNVVNKDFLRIICKVLNRDGTHVLENIFMAYRKNESVKNWLIGGSCPDSHRILIFKHFLRAKFYRIVKDKNEGIRKIKSWSQNRRELRNQ